MQNVEHTHPVNPFNLLGDADAIAAAIKQAKAWNLKSRVCHPLDRPSRARLSKELAQFDAFIDAESPKDAAGSR
jgi:hypothetical protein